MCYHFLKTIKDSEAIGIEFGGTQTGKTHILHVIHEVPLCGSPDAVERRRTGTLRELTWGPNTCAQCLRLAYLGLELEQTMT